MVVYDMCQSGYRGAYEGASDLKGRVQVLRREFIGTDFTALTTTHTDTFKIFKIGKHQLVNRVWTIVTDADAGGAITLAIGYTDGTNTAATAFEGNANLAATGVTESADDKIFFDDDGYYIILDFSVLTTLEATTEFTVVIELIDLRDAGVTEALTAPV